ncbi:hypothetical protein [Nocardia arizonensis]|uniref:hypothetical protein n=1 Tax=Nocardia arizonensis TaxID=1141647 RepID=UPI0006D20187|nr:hypothetical protein [Nocardia arizonensis]
MTHPIYYSYFSQPLKVERFPDGRLAGSVLDELTGEFVQASQYNVRNAVANMSHPEIWEADLDEFIFHTESLRRQFASGEGPVFPLYQVVKGIYDVARAEDRAVNDEELQLITAIYQRTFALWETGQARS